MVRMVVDLRGNYTSPHSYVVVQHTGLKNIGLVLLVI